MFSSLASFIFGSNTSATTNQDQGQEQHQQQQQQDQRERDHEQQQQRDAENTIEVTSSTPSVTGANSSNNLTRSTINKRGKNKRSKNNRNNNSNNNNKRQQQQQQPQKPPSITKLLTPSDDFDEELDEDDWFIVEKEDEEESLPRTDSEEELSIVEVKSKSSASSPTTAVVAVAGAGAASPAPSAGTNAAAQRRRHHINSHSLYSGPRPQQQRNHLQRAARNGGPRNGSFSVLTLSPPRSITAAVAAAADGGGVTQSLYVVSPNGNGNGSGSGGTFGANVSMEESWFVTPPPCFTSIGPIHMETSPFENLLIEHPSMSVYHSIRTAQEAVESFVNLDLGAEEQQDEQIDEPAPAERVVQEQRPTSARLDRFTAAQLKQEVLARSTQKSLEKKERQSLCRGAIKRANKVRDFQSKGNRQRRADMQHCKVVSGANNNRKCCY